MNDDPRLAAFAAALDAEMKRARVNQTELGGKAGLSQGVISAWLLRKTTDPEPQRVFAAERALGCAPGHLSRHLGFVPVVDEPVVDVVHAIQHTADVTDDQRDALLLLYNLFRRQTADA